MSLLKFGTFGLWANVPIFAMAAACVWWAGTRLTGYLDAIADRARIEHAFAGMLLLGGITSLSEVAAVSTSSWTGNASLAVNNLLGSVAINVLLIALADAVLGRDAITSAIGKSPTLMQGVLSITALAFAAMAIVSGDVPVAGVGAWCSPYFATVSLLSGLLPLTGCVLPGTPSETRERRSTAAKALANFGLRSSK
ncbi:hypothetical protein [Microvirga pakistanensis]|uniref:hypothetical protein n=1 Tax=Microvirga pakistanensis TaxID=1682650 RepID=UPI0019579C82|nr:hypothetical protein [Microvirga pakistanensis]